jgi:hypothetical protein
MATINELQAKDFSKWCRKQVRQFGRKAEICNQQYSAVEIWLKELGIEAGFICGGEVEYERQRFTSDWQAIGYYMMDEEGMMETKAGRWLDICELENQEAYLIGR